VDEQEFIHYAPFNSFEYLNVLPALNGFYSVDEHLIHVPYIRVLWFINSLISHEIVVQTSGSLIECVKYEKSARKQRMRIMIYFTSVVYSEELK